MKKLFLITIGVVAVFALGCLLGRTLAPRQEVFINHTSTSDTLTDWQVMQLALIKTESEWDELAIGNTNDLGILQITPIYVKEVNRILGEERYIHEDAFSPQKSLDMFSIMQNKHNPLNDIEKAIASHNPTATHLYSVRVRRNMNTIKKYEDYRRIIK